MADRQGIEIDYCPDCRGVWLDRGELDKIIERSSSASTAPAKHESRESEQYDHGSHGYNKKQKKRKSFLGELLDF